MCLLIFWPALSHRSFLSNESNQDMSKGIFKQKNIQKFTELLLTSLQDLRRYDVPAKKRALGKSYTFESLSYLE